MATTTTMADKVYPDFRIITGDYNGFKRVMNIMLMTNTKEVFIQIRDYYNNGDPVNDGLCFRWREFIWFLDHSISKRDPYGIFASKKGEIFYDCDKISGNFINVYQRIKVHRSIIIFHRSEIQHLFDRKQEIIDTFEEALKEYENPSQKFNDLKSSTNTCIESRDWTEEPMDLNEEPQAINLQ